MANCKNGILIKFEQLVVQHFFFVYFNYVLPDDGLFRPKNVVCIINILICGRRCLLLYQYSHSWDHAFCYRLPVPYTLFRLNANDCTLVFTSYSIIMWNWHIMLIKTVIYKTETNHDRKIHNI